MPLFHTDEQTMIKEMVAPLLAEQGSGAIRAQRDLGPETAYSSGQWRQFVEMQLPGLLVSSAHGGGGLGHVEAGIVMEEIGRTLSPSPFLASAIGAVTALGFADDALQARWLPALAGGAIAALAIDEGLKHRPGHVALSARAEKGGFRLNGVKRSVVGASEAELLIVNARTSGAVNDESGLTLFALSLPREGVRVEGQRLIDGSVAAMVRFDDALVEETAVIGETGQGRAPLSAMVDAVRIGAAAELVGVASAAAALALAHLKQRSQFGRLIGQFQALQHRAAMVYVEIEIARAAVLKAQHLLDAGDPAAPLMIAVAKSKAGAASRRAVQEGVQMHGGMGMTDEHDVGLYMKRDRVLDEMFGDAGFHADRVAQLNGY